MSITSEESIEAPFQEFLGNFFDGDSFGEAESFCNERSICDMEDLLQHAPLYALTPKQATYAEQGINIYRLIKMIRAAPTMTKELLMMVIDIQKPSDRIKALEGYPRKETKVAESAKKQLGVYQPGRTGDFPAFSVRLKTFLRLYSLDYLMRNWGEDETGDKEVRAKATLSCEGNSKMADIVAAITSETLRATYAAKNSIVEIVEALCRNHWSPAERGHARKALKDKRHKLSEETGDVVKSLDVFKHLSTQMDEAGELEKPENLMRNLQLLVTSCRDEVATTTMRALSIQFSAKGDENTAENAWTIIEEIKKAITREKPARAKLPAKRSNLREGEDKRSCFLCGKQGHLKVNCPSAGQRSGGQYEQRRTGPRCQCCGGPHWIGKCDKASDDVKRRTAELFAKKRELDNDIAQEQGRNGDGKKPK